MKNRSQNPVDHVGPYRVVHMSKTIDPKSERRRCKLNRHQAVVQGVTDFQTDIDIVSHLGTHVEAPYHHGSLEKDVTAYHPSYFLGRGILLNLESCGPNELISRTALEVADRDRVRQDVVVILDSNYHHEPFVVSENDRRPHLSREAAEWFVMKKIKAVAFGDGICIETDMEQCNACHDIMLANDVLFIEVIQNIDKLNAEIFCVTYLPIPIKGIDSSPVNMVAIEGIPGFC